MPRVLVIEDERKILRSLERGLQAEGYEVATASTGEDGYRLATTQPFDCLILDLLLPGRSGLEILADLKRHGFKAPVLILTARDAVQDRVVGLDAGAEDYLVKPFAFAELLARLRVLLRRERGERETVLRADDLEVDLVERRARRGGVELALTQREFDVLVYLLRHKNAVITVQDTGAGIPAEHLPRVFDRFYRVDQARGRAEGGTGLGLSIAQSIVAAHGGRIELTSTPGQGTICTITFPERCDRQGAPSM